MHLLKPRTTVIPAYAGIQNPHPWVKPLDYSLRSPFGPPLRAFNAQALLSGFAGMTKKRGRRLN